MNASLSLSLIFMARVARTSGSSCWSNILLLKSESSSATSTVRLFEICLFFFDGHARARCPCFPHSKHRPVFRYSSFSLSLVAFLITADVSIASSFLGGRRCRAGCEFPRHWPCCDLPCPCPGRRQKKFPKELFPWRCPSFDRLWGPPGFFFSDWIIIQLRCCFCAELHHPWKVSGLSLRIMTSTRGCGSP